MYIYIYIITCKYLPGRVLRNSCHISRVLRPGNIMIIILSIYHLFDRLIVDLSDRLIHLSLAHSCRDGGNTFTPERYRLGLNSAHTSTRRKSPTTHTQFLEFSFEKIKQGIIFLFASFGTAVISVAVYVQVV